MRVPLVALLVSSISFSATPAERLDLQHLEAVHAQRIEWIKQRPVAPPPLGIYQDFRAVLASGTADPELLVRAAKAADVRVVLFSEAGPLSGKHEDMLFLHGAGNQDLRFPDEAPEPPKQPKELRGLEGKFKQYPDEVFAVAGDALRESRENRKLEAAFRNLSMHILARALTETEIRKSLEEGRFYLAHDWLCDPAGFMFVAENGLGAFEIGDHAPFANTTIEARVPIPARLRLLRNGEMIAEVNDSKISHAVTEEGDYRLEAWLKIDGEDRPWIYSSPLRIRKSPPLTLPFAAVPSNVEVRKDVVYVEGDPSDRAKHELDLYLPKDRKGFPAIVFLHGGTWRTGDRAQYAALGNRFASLGIGVAIPSYRLMPGHPHPAQIEDAAAAFAWVHEHLAEAGGDAARIYLLGHSAGGHLAALLALDREYLKKYDISTDAIRGVMSMSGVYNLAGVSGFISASGARDPSPLHHVHSQAPPFLVTFCQWDYLGLPKQARDFSAALKKSFVGAQLLYVAGKSHITEIIDVLRDDDPTARAILDFMK